ncbi:transposase-like protein [Bradyrhizobium sp. USDA 3397]
MGSDPRRKSAARSSDAEAARKHGATRWQIYRWRRRFRQRGELSSREAPQPPFAPLVVDGPLEKRHVPAVKLEIAIGDVVVRTDAAKTDAAIDGEQLSRLIRAVRASRHCPRLRTEDLYRDATRRLPLGARWACCEGAGDAWSRSVQRYGLRVPGRNGGTGLRFWCGIERTWCGCRNASRLASSCGQNLRTAWCGYRRQCSPRCLRAWIGGWSARRKRGAHRSLDQCGKMTLCRVVHGTVSAATMNVSSRRVAGDSRERRAPWYSAPYGPALVFLREPTTALQLRDHFRPMPLSRQT